MKKSKLLFLVPSVVVATTIPFIASCSKHGLLIQDIEDAIFNPVENEQKVTGTYVEQLKSSSKNDLQKELIYRLFAANEPWFTDFIQKAHKDDAINIISNIKTCEITFDSNKVLASFAGYIDFIFKKDWDSFEKNDVWQITFMFDKWDATPYENPWCLRFDTSPIPYPAAFGIIEIIKNGEKQPLWTINTLTPANIPNWHHWTNN